jgi:hypothetical protein
VNSQLTAYVNLIYTSEVLNLYLGLNVFVRRDFHRQSQKAHENRSLGFFNILLSQESPFQVRT